MKRINTLHIGYCPKNYAQTSREHFSSLSKSKNLRVFELTNLGKLPSWIDLNWFDCIVIHYSIYLAADYIVESDRILLKNFKGIKVLTIQDEYRHVLKTVRIIREIDFDLLFTCIPENEIQKVYPDSLVRAKKVNVLTGYIDRKSVPKRFTGIPFKNRTIDISYRSRKLPGWYGSLALEKWKIVDEVSRNLPSDIAANLSYLEEERIYGEKWINFLQNSKSALGVESGSNVIDYSGEIQLQGEYLENRLNASYDEIVIRLITNLDNQIKMNQISPRAFECAINRTPMILFEGNYSGILTPVLHYFPLKKDLSNFSEAIDFIRDEQRLLQTAKRTFSHVYENDQLFYEHFAHIMGSEIKKIYDKKQMKISTLLMIYVTLIKIPLFFHNRRLQWELGPVTRIALKNLPMIILADYVLFFAGLIKIFYRRFKLYV